MIGTAKEYPMIGPNDPPEDPIDDPSDPPFDPDDEEDETKTAGRLHLHSS
jgi:hypothetical protein